MSRREVKNNSKGQVAVEYILMLFVGVTIWLMLIGGLVSRNPATPGPIIRVWAELVAFVAGDQIENVQPPQ